MTPVNPYEPPRSATPATIAGRLPVRATGVLTPEDALRALAAVGKWRPWRFSLIGLSIMAVGLLVLSQGAGGIKWPLIFAAAIFGLAMALGVLNAKRKFRKAWNARPEHAQPIVWTFSDEGLFIESMNSKHLHSWTAFVYARITPDKLILAQHGDAMFNFVPRRCFDTDADWLAVSQLLVARLPVR